MAKMKAIQMQLNEDIIALDELRRQKDELEDTIDALQQRIVATLDSLEVKTHEVEVKGGRSIKATRSQSNRTVIDETGLKKSLMNLVELIMVKHKRKNNFKLKLKD